MDNSNDLFAKQPEPVLEDRIPPIWRVIEEVLKEKEIPYETFPVRGGLDVRSTRGYSIRLPAVEIKTRGMLGRILGRTRLEPTITLEEITPEIDKRYFGRFDPVLSQSRPELAKPSILTSRVAGYFVSAPPEEQTSNDFIDVVRIEVVGYQATN